MIETYCINTDKPELNCNGNCHLSSEIEKSLDFPEKNDLALKIQHIEIPTILCEKLELEYHSLKGIAKLKLFYSNNYSFEIVKQIFHPPQIFPEKA